MIYDNGYKIIKVGNDSNFDISKYVKDSFDNEYENVYDFIKEWKNYSFIKSKKYPNLINWNFIP